MNNLITKYLAHFTNEKDSGRVGKAAELAVREYLSGKEQERVKAQGKADAYFTFNLDGKRKSVTVEIKTACGVLDGAERSQFIAYCPEVVEGEEVESQFFVFTREEWKAMLNGYEGRGSLLKVDSQRGQVHFQSFRSESRPKASRPIADYLWNACYEQPTLEEWKEELRG
jgi:hypothetical protein